MKSPGWLPVALIAVLGAPACAGPGLQAASSVPVIVGFTQSTDVAAPATLAQLTQASGAAVRFVAAISPQSAAYRLDCAAADPDCARALAALRALPAVQYLDIDQKKGFR